MDHHAANGNLWSLPASELAEDCRAMAESAPGKIDEAHKAEAVRLYAGWQEALAKPVDSFDDRARHAALIEGLRKRTIEVLIRIRGRE